LSLALKKLCLEIRFDPLGRYSAHEHPVALASVLKSTAGAGGTKKRVPNRVPE
jgi:hypothetical protein